MAAPNSRVQTLIDIYRRGYVQVLEQIVDATNRGLSAHHLKSARDDIQDILDQIDVDAARWIEREIPRSYREGMNQASSTLRRMGQRVAPMQAGFSQSHRHAVQVMASNLQDSLRDATQRIGRRVDDVFRDQALRAVSEGLATQRTVGDTAGRMLLGIVEAGHDGFVDRAGRHWRLDRYVDMAAQTTTREAVTTGTLNQLTDLGYDLVQITEHFPTCPVCAVHQGRVYSISGKTEGYPILDERPPYHPYCAHVCAPYIPELADDPVGDRRRSNAPMTTGESWSDAEREAYLEQSKRAEARRNRRLRIDAQRRERIFDKRYEDVLSQWKGRAHRNASLRNIRMAELNAMKSGEVRSVIGQGRGNWPIYNIEYHLAEHGTELGVATLAAYHQTARQIAETSPRVFTQYYPGQRSRQWIYVRETQHLAKPVVDVVVWDQKSRQFQSAWRSSPKDFLNWIENGPALEVSPSLGRPLGNK